MRCLGSLFGAYTGILRVAVEIIFNMVNPVIIVYDFADIFDVLICGCVAVYATQCFIRVLLESGDIVLGCSRKIKRLLVMTRMCAPLDAINATHSLSGRSDSRIPVCIYSETGGVFLTVTAIIAMVANNRTKIALIRALNMVSPPCLIYILLYCKSVRPGNINLEKTIPYQTICTDHIVGEHDCKGFRRHNCYAHYPLSILNFAQKKRYDSYESYLFRYPDKDYSSLFSVSAEAVASLCVSTSLSSAASSVTLSPFLILPSRDSSATRSSTSLVTARRSGRAP